MNIIGLSQGENVTQNTQHYKAYDKNTQDTLDNTLDNTLHKALRTITIRRGD